jgi:hypothetical protein
MIACEDNIDLKGINKLGTNREYLVAKLISYCNINSGLEQQT